MVRYYRVRNEILAKLGGRCVKCGSRERLEIDHIDPLKKSDDISRISNVSMERIMAEVSKCQVLCNGCHIIKTLADNGRKAAKGSHGTLSSYRYCKCEQCREAKASYHRRYRETHKRVTVDGRRISVKV